MKTHLVGYGVGLLMLFVAIYVASVAWKSGQKPATAAGETPAAGSKTKEALMGYAIALIMLFVAIYVASVAWKSGQKPAGLAPAAA
jgi:disulfide bond formation protein DsbB